MSEELLVLKELDTVRLEHRGRVVHALVMLASPNGRSLMLRWEPDDFGPLWVETGVYMGQIAVLRDEDTNTFHEIIGDEVVLVERL